MAMENRTGVVMGFPADYFETRPRYEEPTSVTITPDRQPFPCNNHGKKHHRLRPLIFTLLMLFACLALFGFTMTYKYNRAPVIQIDSITSSNIASSNNTTISANWHLTFSLKNPNKHASIHYKKIQVSVFDNDKHLCYGDVDYFYQGKSEEGHMNVEILGVVVNLEKQKMNDAKEMAMVFSLKLDAVVLLDTKFTKNYWQLLEASCGDVKVRPPMSLELDGARRCNVDVY